MTFAQETHVFEEWVSTSGTQDFYIHGKSVTDAAGSVYQVGATLNDIGGYDAIISKHDRSGQELWTEIFNPSTTGDDTFIDVILTSSGDVVATGVSRNSSETASDVFTVQLNAGTGNTDWQDSYSYSGSIYNVGSALATDGSDNVYVTGITSNFTTLSDVLVMKYNSTGSLQWAVSEDVNGMEDGAVKLACSGGKLTASGATQVLADKYRYLVIEFDAFDGSLINSFEGSDDVTSVDQVQDLVVDDAGNIYITGYAGATGEGYNMYTVKLNDELNILWEDSYNHSGSNHDRGYGIALDNSGNVIVTGCSDVSEGNTQFTTLKYNSTGTLQWVKADDISAGADTARAVITDANDNIYITGSFSNGSNQDVKTIKYSPAGTQLWAIDYNGQANGDEYVLDITLDEDDVLVCTQTWTGSTYKYAAIRYSELEYTDLSFSSSEEVNPLAFLKNNGQLRDTAGNGHPEVKYMSKYGQSLSFYKDDGFDWMVRSSHNDSTVNDTVHKVAFDFVNPTSELKVRPYQKADYFENHYIPQGMQKYERLPVYGKLLYSEVWDDIDMETCLVGDKELRFTVNKGGKISDIKLALAGADSTVKQPDGTVDVYFFSGPVKLTRARAYQETTPGNLQELTWQPALKLTGNTLSIDSIGAYDTSKDIIIRIGRGGGGIPQEEGFCHSTYFGGLTTFILNGTTDLNGNPIFCGQTSNSNFFAGILGTTILGNSSNAAGFVSKFNRDLVPQFSTVILGERDDLPVEVRIATLSIDNENNIFSAGRVWVDDVFTINDEGAAYYEGEPQEAKDGYLMKLSGGDGILTYATIFGGVSMGTTAGHDVIRDIAFDGAGHLYLVGRTTSDGFNGFPFTPLDGAHNDEGPGGFIARFDDVLDVEWCTRYGTASSVIDKIAVSGDDKIAVAGSSSDPNSFIDTFPGTTQNLIPSGTDWFLTVFNSSGQPEWGTYEGSDDDDNRGNSDLVFGSDNSLYFGASIFSTSGVDFIDPEGSAYFNDTNSGPSSVSDALHNYGLLVHYEAGTYTPDWRTLLMDGDSWNTVNSLEYKDDGKLYLSGTTRDGSMSLVQADTDLYSGVKTMAPSGTNLEGYFMIFGTEAKNLVHSSYYGGHKDDNQEAFAINDDQEVFGFGFTGSRYGPDLLGIPLKNNEVPGSWYDDQEDFATYLNLGYVFKLCLNGTPLSVSEEPVKYSKDKFSIYPNPVRAGSSYFRIDPSFEGIGIISITDIGGKLIMQQRNERFESGKVNTIHLRETLSPGLYMITIETDRNNYSQKLIAID